MTDNLTKKQIFFHPQRFFLDNIPKQRDGECYVLNAEYGELWAAYGEQEQEIERLKAALRLLTNGNKYSTEVCNIARGALAQSDHEPTADVDAKLKELRARMMATDEPQPVAWRYKDSRGHWRYVGNRPNWDFGSEYASLKPEPLFTSDLRT